MLPVISSITATQPPPVRGGTATGAQLPAIPAVPPRLAGAPTATKVPSPEQIAQAIETANKALKANSSNLEFVQDESTGKTIIRILDSATRQVIRQYPTEEMLAIARNVDRMRGALLEEKA